MDDRNRFGAGPVAPVKVGEELVVTIEAVGEKGDGIAKKNGFVLFVPNVKEGDTVKIKVTKVLRRVGFAESLGPADAADAPAPAEDDAAPAEPEEVPEDSDDFGEEEPAEDVSEEEPVEEDSAEDVSEEDEEKKLD